MILCVEDEADLRADLAEELRDAGYETAEAANGAEGLKAILDLEPDLVFCDVTMPVMNGIAMFETLRREHPRLAGTKFVFLSALDDIPCRVDLDLRVEEFLTKPVDFDVVLSSVKRIVGGPADIARRRAAKIRRKTTDAAA